MLDPTTGIPTPGHIRCYLCGQVYPQDERCGCGKSIIENVSIPKSKLREWRRGLTCCVDHRGLGSIHASEIIEEIESYLNG